MRIFSINQKQLKYFYVVVSVDNIPISYYIFNEHIQYFQCEGQTMPVLSVI